MNKYRRTRLVNILQHKESSIMLKKNSRKKEIKNSLLFKHTEICSECNVCYSCAYTCVYFLQKYKNLAIIVFG